MSETEEQENVADSADAGPEGAGAAGAEGHTEGGPRRRRRRRRGRGRGTADPNTPPTEGAEVTTAAEATPPARPQATPRNPQPSHERRDAMPPPAPRPPSREASAFASLTAGLFSHLDDRQVACKVEGCTRAWTWTAAEQIEAFGQPPPKRMCAEHHAAMHTVEDREVRCSNPWCERTWTWTKSAQLAQLSRSNQSHGKSDPSSAPSRTCDHCQREDRELGDAEIACRVDGCANTWTWTRDAQLKHRAWMRHQPAGGPPEGARGGRRRRGRAGRSGRGGIEGPAPRMCDACRQRLNALVDRETTCKVHGCTRTVTIDRESQLRAWVAAADQPASELALPKRMCEVCREFCRLHHDREVACGRSGCDRMWTYKTGAQLQAFLAGRFEDPLRLCATCVASGHAQTEDVDARPGYDTMPCIVPQCDGIWHYAPSMDIGPCNDGDRPLDRMCDACRTERGADVRSPMTSAAPSDDVDDRDDGSIETSEVERDTDEGDEHSIPSELESPTEVPTQIEAETPTQIETDSQTETQIESDSSRD